MFFLCVWEKSGQRGFVIQSISGIWVYSHKGAVCHWFVHCKPGEEGVIQEMAERGARRCLWPATDKDKYHWYNDNKGITSEDLDLTKDAIVVLGERFCRCGGRHIFREAIAGAAKECGGVRYIVGGTGTNSPEQAEREQLLNITHYYGIPAKEGETLEWFSFHSGNIRPFKQCQVMCQLQAVMEVIKMPVLVEKYKPSFLELQELVEEFFNAAAQYRQRK